MSLVEDVGEARKNGAWAFGYYQRLLMPHHMVQPGDRVLDVGCGYGSLALPLVEMGVSYIGIDIRKSCIDFCKAVYADVSEFTFIHMDVHNDRYNRSGSRSPLDVQLPDGPFDFIIAASLFSHLETLNIATHYMQQITHALRPGGRFYSTWFRSPPNCVSSSAQRTVYRETDILNLLSPFDIIHTRDGMSLTQHDQWKICSRLRSL